MSDRSFGDYTNRNIVKNPLLSTAVTGLSLDDLTHKAVLLPVTPTQGQIARPDQPLGDTNRENKTYPHGDTVSLNPPIHPTQSDSLPPKGNEPWPQTKVQKTNDDFDVNEYIARLQGSRYVSAPLHSHIKEDTNANLQAEENLEEINLNESAPAEVQQSITADLAQNFSQLPTVLPHVASAVFSSFSNMLNLRSKEQSPEGTKVQENVDVGVPLMGVEENVYKEFAPPPIEPPVLSGPSNYRLPVKKKYAQIPGLSSGDTQNVPFNQPITQSVPSFFTPETVAHEDNHGTAQNNAKVNVFNPTELQSTENRNNDVVTPQIGANENQPKVLTMDTESNKNPPAQEQNTQIIPPPPMFSSLKRDNQSATGNSILPPSVARRISANQPIMKQQNLPQTFTDNIFVPTLGNEEDQASPFNMQANNATQALPAHQMFPPTGQLLIGQTAQHIGQTNQPSIGQTAQSPIGQIGAPPIAQGQPIGQRTQPPIGQISHPPIGQIGQPIGQTNQPHMGQIGHPPIGQSVQPFGQIAQPPKGQIGPPIGQIGQPIGQTSHASIGQISAPIGQIGPPPTGQAFSPLKPPVAEQNTPPTFGQIQMPSSERSAFKPIDSMMPNPVGSMPPMSEAFVQPPMEYKDPSQSSLPPTSFNAPPSLNPGANTGVPLFFTPAKETGFKGNVIDPTIGPPKQSAFASNIEDQNTVPFFTSPVLPQPPTNPYQTSDILQVSDSANEPTRPLVEPPKATSNSNFRMVKKRPQYYSGPIEGIGSISNNVKPVIPTAMPVANAFQPNLFTPAQVVPTVEANSNLEGSQADIQAPPSYFSDSANTPFDISKPTQQISYAQDNKTAFDVSRPATEKYDPPKQESGFGLIGSLKSKLSSIDMNMIQSTVSSFFDPDYHGLENAQQIYYIPEKEKNFDIFVPPNEQNKYNQSNYQQNQQSGYNYNENYENQYGYGQNTYAPQSYTGQGQYSSISTGYNQNYPEQNIPSNDNLNTEENISYFNQSNQKKTIYPLSSPFYDPDDIVYPNDDDDEAINAAIEIATDVLKDTVDDKQSTDKVNPIQEPKQTVKPIQQETFESLTNPANFFDVQQQTQTENFGNVASSFFNPSHEVKSDNVDVIDKMSNLAIKNDEAEKHDTQVYSSNIFGNTSKAENIKDDINIFGNTSKTDNVKDDLVSSVTLKQEKEMIEEITPKESTLMESLSKADIPIVGVSAVPLFGLSAIIADKSKEISTEAERTNFLAYDTYKGNPSNLFKTDANVSFFENLDASKNKEKDLHMLNITDVKNVLLIEPPQDNISTVLKGNLLDNLDNKSRDSPKTVGGPVTADNVNMLFDNSKSTFFEHLIPTEDKENKDAKLKESENDSLSICETCREVNSPVDKDAEDVTSQLIENINAPIQLSNPVGVPLQDKAAESSQDKADVNDNQLNEITNITEDTIEMLQVQSATELLDDAQASNIKNYGWNEDFTPTNMYNTNEAEDYGFQINPAPNQAQNFDFKIDPNSIGFFSNNSLFFDNVPNNASDEIKAEYQSTHEDDIREMSIPSAPPAEEDTKSDETGGLDVHSIEQDAKKDFPLDEEFVIEPSETDDDKMEFRERKKSSEDSSVCDTFTNRVERFQKESEYDQHHSYCAPKSMASYFDTGNYAVETHYKNAFAAPIGSSNSMRMPPGFEAEYRRKMSVIAALSDNKPIKVPDTETQTKITDTPSYSRPNERSPDIMAMSGQQLPAFAETFGAKVKEDLLPKEQLKTLPDHINFFSSTEETAEEKTGDFNRLASYFSQPAPKPDHSKSFFELSQSQNHYRHESTKKNDDSFKQIDENTPFFELGTGQNTLDDNTLSNIANLMQDLTSIQNLEIKNEDTVKTVNYFTLDYDFKQDIKLKNMKEYVDVKENTIINTKNDTNSDNDINSESDYVDVTNSCQFCTNILNSQYKVKQAVNEDNNSKSSSLHDDTTGVYEKSNLSKKMSTEQGYNIEKDLEDGVQVTQEGTTSEYSAVKHHWFYRVDVEDKSVWRGFSLTDSNALEHAYRKPDLSDTTLVPTDGGRYDVNVVGRLRIAVYWKEKPTNVRRCSWFFKGTTDARYVPYTEQVAEKLEEEYRHGVTTNEWHRRLVLPNNEMVIMHGPSVMVHFLSGGASDAFTSPTPSSRPRVVRRGYEESEIEDLTPSNIEHLLLLCHGVGSACDMRFRSLEEVVEDFRTTSLQLLQSHYKNSYDSGIVNRVEVLPISWHAQLHAGEAGVDGRLARVTLDSIPRLRAFTNHTVLDVLFYTSPVYHQTIMDTVCSELNRIYSLFKKRNPDFKGGVSLGGHSLGSVILYDLLCNQPKASAKGGATAEKSYLPGINLPDNIKYPVLEFSPDALYALGSPIAIFECIRGVESLGLDFCLPTCKKFFNIFHPYDPIAYRIEPLINPQLQDVKPYLIPHHKGRKRMHLELKDTMARVGADLKQKLVESLRTTWNKWKATPPTDGQLEKVVEEEMEKEQLCDEDTKDDTNNIDLTSSGMLGRLNDGQRIDYVLQEAPLEMINEYLFAMSSHVGYWESEDTMLLILREIYSSLGVEPDSTVPQQSMTVQRTSRTHSLDEAMIVNEKEYPSTSKGSL